MTLPAELHLAAPRRAPDDEVPTPPPAHDRLVVLERLSDVAVRIASSVELQDVLDGIGGAVVESLGFDAAVLNIVQGDDLHVAVVKGPQEVCDALAGTTQRRALWEELLTRSTALGGLRSAVGWAR